MDVLRLLPAVPRAVPLARRQPEGLPLHRREHRLQADRRRGAVPVRQDEAVLPGGAGTNCIEIGLPGKLILSERKGLCEVLFSGK